MGKQITVGRLKEILSDIDDNYIVQLGINEESDLLTHIFIDNESGVVDLTNFEDKDENDAICLDAFGNELYDGDKILEFDIDIGEIYKEKVKIAYPIFRIGHMDFVTPPDKKEKIKNIVRYEW